MKKILKVLIVLCMILGFTCAFAADNPEGSTIAQNGTIIDNNYGTVTENNNTVTNNYGTVTNNKGSVGSNKESGTVAENNNAVSDNYGEITENGSNGMIEHNRGKLSENNGIVTANDEGGTVSENNGSIQMNNETVVTNAESGEIKENYGTVSENNGNVGKNDINSYITENNGIVAENNGIITENNGTVTNNYGTVTENNAAVTENNGTVTENNGNVGKNSGTVKVNNNNVVNTSQGVVSENFGYVNNRNGGTVTDNYGYVTNPGSNLLQSLLYESYLGSHNDGIFAVDNGQDGQGYLLPVDKGVALKLFGQTFSQKGYRQVGWKDRKGNEYAFGAEFTLDRSFSNPLIAVFEAITVSSSASPYKTYIVLEGDKGVWNGADEGLTFVIDCPFRQFQDVKAGDPDVLAKNLPILDPSCYEVREGENNTTVITLLPAYLKTLTSRQRIEFRFGDGAAYASFEVEIENR